MDVIIIRILKDNTFIEYVNAVVKFEKISRKVKKTNVCSICYRYY